MCYWFSFFSLIINLSHNCLKAIKVLRLSITQYSLILSPIVSVGNGMNDEILTLKEVAEYLKLAEKTAYRLAACPASVGIGVFLDLS